MLIIFIQIIIIFLVGANFAANDSLSSRYSSFLTSHPLTSPSTFLFSDPTCVLVATHGSADPLTVLQKLSQRLENIVGYYYEYLQLCRHGFARCSGRLFACDTVVTGLNNFYKHLKQNTPDNVVIRTHAHPQQFAADILDYVDEDEECRSRSITCSPTHFTHVLVAVRMSDDRVGWGLYSAAKYKHSICRPGDGDR